MMVVTITILKGEINTCKVYNIIGSSTSVQNTFLCSLGIHLGNYISNLNNKEVYFLLSAAQTFILLFFLVCYSNIKIIM